MPSARRLALLAGVVVACSPVVTVQARSEPAGLPFLTEEAPLASLARAFGFYVRSDIATARVRLVSEKHEIVIAPGICRALVDGMGYPLLGRPRYEGGTLVAPPDLADLVRSFGSSPPEAEAPLRLKPPPGARPKAAFLPAPTSPARAVLGSFRQGCSSGTGRAGGRAIGDTPPSREAKGEGNHKAPRASAGFIVLDPGHGGRDGGGRGRAGTKEKDVVLDIAKRTAAHLRRKDVKVTLTRDGDRYLNPEKRARISNALSPDMFVSLHTNSYRLPSASGIETWVLARKLVRSKGAACKSRTLAKVLQRALVKAMPSRDRGVREGYYKVLRYSKVPAALVEIGFISNPEEERKLADPKWREKIAEALAKAAVSSGVLVKRAR